MSTTCPAADTVNILAARWAARHPDLASRLGSAKALVANVQPGDRSPNVFFVEGSAGRRYMVRVNRQARTSSCTCPDHGKRGGRCKHILAVAFWVAGQG